MTACSDHNPNNGGVALHHLFGGLTGAASRVDPDLLTNSESRHATGKGHINVQALSVQGRTDRRLDGVEEAMQS